MPIRPRRSVLYMPGSIVRALEKARSLAADALILDLEDSIAPDLKAVARDNVCAAVTAGGYGHRELVIRINSLSGPWGRDDLAAAVKAAPNAVLLPKVSTPGDIMLVAKEMRDLGASDDLAIWAMMETPLAILNADSIVRTAADPSSRLAVLVMGTNDIAKDTRARLTKGRASMVTWLSICVAAARAHGVEILDGVFNDIADTDGFREECEQGRDFGMDGKTVIHPSQLAICNDIFSPSSDELAWAHKLIAAFDLPENANKGAISLDGRMVERLHAEMAKRTLELDAAIAKMQLA